MVPRMLTLGYNTNGFAHHRWRDAFEILAEIGYRSVALTLDVHLLDPYGAHLAREIREVRQALLRHELRSVIETGARFLLDSRVKHEPTLVSPDPAERARRLDFLKRAVDIAAALDADAVSFWAGVLRDDAPADIAWQRLVEGCRELVDYAEKRRVRLAFEPEPGMFIETMRQFDELVDRLHREWFGLTIDVGHLHCLDDGDIAEQLRRYAPRLLNVHLEDMRRGVHEHLRFGEGEIDFPPVLQALSEIDFSGGVHVELSRHSHMAPEAARESFEFLSALVPNAG